MRYLWRERAEGEEGERVEGTGAKVSGQEQSWVEKLEAVCIGAKGDRTWVHLPALFFAVRSYGEIACDYVNKNYQCIYTKELR